VVIKEKVLVADFQSSTRMVIKVCFRALMERRLDWKTRRVLMLKAEKYTWEEIAEMEDLTVRQARYRWEKGLKVLSRNFGLRKTKFILY